MSHPEAPPTGSRAAESKPLSGPATLRAAIRRLPGGWLIWRIGVTLVGFVVIAVGLVLIPLPGPGWLIVFLGLGIWSTEYAWARRLTTAVRRRVERWWSWMGRQRRWLQFVTAAVGLASTAAVSLAAWYIF